MRKSFNALAVIIHEQIKEDPANGALYVFCNRSQDKLKILQWEKNGFWLHYKRLAKGKFSIPTKEDADLTINNLDLMYLLDVKSVAPTKMF